MPRVPEGRFRTEPSSRVDNVRIPKIESGGNKLRKLGGQFLKVSESLEQAKSSADSLQEISTEEENFNTSVMPELEEFANTSENGKVKDADGNLVPLSQAVQTRLSAYQTETLSRIKSGKHAESGVGHFAKFISPKLDRVLQKAEKTETTQIVDGITNTLSTDTATLTQRYIDGAANPEDFLSLQSKIIQSSGSIGSKKSNQLLKTLNQSIGYSSISMVASQGATPENVATAKQNIAKLPEAIQREYGRKLDDYVENRRRIDTERAFTQSARLIKGLKSPKDWMTNANKVAQYQDTFENTPLNEFETIDQREAMYSNLMGKKIASEIFFGDPSLDVNSSEVKEALEQRLASHFMSIQNKAISKLDAGRTPTEVSSRISDKIKDAVNAEMGRITKQREDDVYGFITEHDESIIADMTSGNPERQATGIDNFNSFIDKAGIARDKVRLVSGEQAKLMGQAFKSFTKGDDPTGQKAYEETIKASLRFGDMADKGIRDLIDLGGMPPAAAYMHKAGNEAMGKQIAAGYVNYDTNLTAMIQSGKLQSSQGKKGSKSAFESLVFEEIGDIDGVLGLYSGRPGTTKALFEGYTQSVTLLAAQIAATNEGVDVKDAISQATELMKEDFKIENKGNSTILMDRAYADKNNIPFDKGSDIMNSMRKMEHLEGAGFGVDISAMKKIYARNPFISGQLAAFEGLAKSNKKKAHENFLHAFGDSVVIVPDPDQHNRAQYFIRDQRTSKLIPMITNGNKPLTVPIKDYYDRMSFVESTNAFKSRSRGSMGSFNRMAQ
jgi:hypothetical protein